LELVGLNVWRRWFWLVLVGVIAVSSSCARNFESTSSDFLDDLPIESRTFTRLDVTACQEFFDSGFTENLEQMVDYELEYPVEELRQGGPNWIVGLWRTQFGGFVDHVSRLPSFENVELQSRKAQVLDAYSRGEVVTSEALSSESLKSAWVEMYRAFELINQLCEDVYYRFGS
jgi:hypothetical protein